MVFNVVDRTNKSLQFILFKLKYTGNSFLLLQKKKVNIAQESYYFLHVIME